MTVLAVNQIRQLLDVVILVYIWAIVLRSVLTWFNLRPGTPLMRVYGLLYSVTEPYLSLFRRILPITRAGSIGIDWSSLVGLLVLFILLRVVSL